MAKTRDPKALEWLPTLLAALAFIGFAVAFGWEIFSYQHKVVGWARRDLQSRADLAASNLEEPLRTQDFRKVREFGDKCMQDGYCLSILGGNGHGLVFDSNPNERKDREQFQAEQQSGDYWVRLRIPMSQVMRPFHRALIGVSLAGMVGVAGVLLFFFVTYRQRVRIRELAKLEKFRREFIADVSHEIKTPLTGIIGAVDMLEGDSPLFPLIRKESQRLNQLVQSILDLARLEREGDLLSKSVTNLTDLVAEVASRYPCQCVAEPDVVANCDAQLVAQAIANLIANAVRHSGSSEIFVSLAKSENGVRIAVEDRGVGVPTEHAERIFERFHRVDPSRAAETGGAGLGLAIVRRIARLHGGDVTYEPAKPKGSRFVITIP